jgi:hypothetical protein
MQIALASQSPIRQFGRYKATSTASVTQLALQRMVKRELGDIYNDLQHNSLQRLNTRACTCFELHGREASESGAYRSTTLS